LVPGVSMVLTVSGPLLNVTQHVSPSMYTHNQHLPSEM